MKSLGGKIAYSASLVAGAVACAFVLFQVLPADPARVALGPYASQANVRALRESLGLDLPIAGRFLRYAGSLSRGDMGRSLVDSRGVVGVVWERFRVTATIGLLATAISAAGSLAINILVLARPGLRGIVGAGRSVAQIPAFVLAVLGALFVAWFIPAVSLGGTGIWGVVPLAAVLAAVHPGALVTAHLRGLISECRRGASYRAARAYGESGAPLFVRHLLRPTVVGWAAALVNQLGNIFFTVILIELTFSIPGTGTLLLASIQRSDYPVLQGLVLINAAFFVLVSLAAEIFYEVADPRVR